MHSYQNSTGVTNEYYAKYDVKCQRRQMDLIDYRGITILYVIYVK